MKRCWCGLVLDVSLLALFSDSTNKMSWWVLGAADHRVLPSYCWHWTIVNS
jgi:hypothetical protein